MSSPIPVPTDARLIVADMDGTLLLPDGAIPGDFWSLLPQLAERGIRFVPASGRQFATLQEMFTGAESTAPEGLSFIAENGGVVRHEGRTHVAQTLAPDLVERVVRTVRAARAGGAHMDLVVCGADGGFVEERDSDEFRVESAKYYRRLTQVEDLLAVDVPAVKLAVFDPVEAADSAREHFAGLRSQAQVVVSGHHWIDMMAPGVDKGVGVRRMQQELGIGAEQTVVFGDFLNDLEMLDAARWSYAMANAHPEVLRRARYTAPPNTEQGVLTVLRRILQG